MKNFLYDIFANWTSYQGVFVYSDPHFGDLESYQLRGIIPTSREYYSRYKDGDECESYESFAQKEVAKADEAQLKRINSIAGKSSCLILLGDVGDINTCKRLRAAYKVLLLGNHDVGATNYKRETSVKKIDIDPYLNGMTPNDIAVKYSEEESDKIYEEARIRACKDLRSKNPEFKLMSDSITYAFTPPYMYWDAVYDNGLFDEVYEGPLMISDKVILSHEPVDVPDYLYDIHGHVHNARAKGDAHHLNCCAEAIDYTPINLLQLFKSGAFKHVDTIHRETIDRATERKSKGAR